MDQGSEDLIPTRHSLLSRLKDWDDQESWRDFFNTYWKLIYSVAVKAGLSDLEAQEVVQETVITVAKKISEFKTDPAAGSFRGWLLHITRWRIADQFRKGARHAALNGIYSDESSTTSIVGKIPDPSGFDLELIWDEEWERNLIDAAIERVKQKVSAKQYQIFYLNVIKGQSARTVAESLGVGAALVHLAKHRVGRLVKREVKILQKGLI